MKTHIHNSFPGITTACCALLLAFTCCALTGCEDDEFDHSPPEGQGTLYIDNLSANDLEVFVNSREERGVGGGNRRYYDMPPGTYRVSLSGDDTERSWSDFVDVLEGKRTIIKVWIDVNDYRRYDVDVYFDD